MNNVMVDIETLDNKPTSAIVSIGAVMFGPNGYDEYNTFYMVVDAQSCIDAGLTLSADTISWWMKQSDQARAVFQQPWDFWNDRCYRTIAAMHDRRRFQQGVHHNALDDAKSQVEHLIQIAPGVCQ